MPPQPVVFPEIREQSFEIPAMSFDRVHFGHVATSKLPLFRLPIELFAQIFRYVGRDDLRALALVDRDCRRLAALYQFKDIKIHFVPELFLKIQGLPIQDPPAPFTSQCVRRVTVASDVPDYSTALSEYAGLAIEELDPPLTCYLKSASDIIESSLPNLYILVWDVPTFVCPNIIHSILSSPAKHLRLNRLKFKEDIYVPLPTHLPVLETLSLQDISWIPGTDPSKPIQFFDTLFRATALTLRQLIWTGQLAHGEIEFGENLLSFPSLRSISLDSVCVNSSHVLRHFLGPSTRVESMSMDSLTASTLEFYRTRGLIPTLIYFCWLNHDETLSLDSEEHEVLIFLRNNPQLEKIHFADPLNAIAIETLILPFLQNNFDSLTSLHLIWAASTIPEQSLEVLASISTLRQLWLSAGNQDSPNTWEIDHQAMLAHLEPLQRLETLAFSRDTYKVGADLLVPRFGDYYAIKALPAGLNMSRYLSPIELSLYEGRNQVDREQAIKEQVTMWRVAWERWHVERVMEWAHEYANTFPVLRWCFFGQLAMSANRPRGFSLVHSPAQREPGLESLCNLMSISLWRPI